jgi:hypothetical protein
MSKKHEKPTDEQPAPPAKPDVSPYPPSLDPEDAHIGATEEQVLETPAPSGDEFKDETRQG